MSAFAKRGKSKSLSAAEAGQHGEAGAVTGTNAAPLEGTSPGPLVARIDQPAVAALSEKVMASIVQTYDSELNKDARNIIKAMVIGVGVRRGNSEQ